MGPHEAVRVETPRSGLQVAIVRDVALHWGQDVELPGRMAGPHPSSWAQPGATNLEALRIGHVTAQLCDRTVRRISSRDLVRCLWHRSAGLWYSLALTTDCDCTTCVLKPSGVAANN